MSILTKSTVSSTQADLEALKNRLAGVKYFTLEQMGVPLELRNSMGQRLTRAGYNKFNMKVRTKVNCWVWLATPGDTVFDYDDARHALGLGNTLGNTLGNMLGTK